MSWLYTHKMKIRALLREQSRGEGNNKFEHILFNLKLFNEI